MIRVRLDYLLLDRRMKLIELADRTGLALNNLSLLKTGKVKAIRFSTLESICRALECQPGELLVYLPDKHTDDGDEPGNSKSDMGEGA